MDNFLRTLVGYILPAQERRDVAVDAVYEIAPTFVLTVVVVLICEAASYKTAVALRKTKEGAALHTSGFVSTLFNLFVVGIPVHVAARLIVPAGEERRGSAWEVLGRIAAFVALQNVLFYLAHMAMHTPALYWMHRYHHRYNTHVVPSSANAVSVSEFLFAYIVPPALVLIVVRPTRFENVVAMNVIAQCSTLVHTPCLEEWSARHLPAWWVGTSDHCEHHRRLTKNYAAPCLNLDYLLGRAAAAPKGDAAKWN